jgi:hypothetical protein
MADADQHRAVRHPDRRDDERVRLLGSLAGEVMLFQPMAVSEINGHGLQIDTAFPLQLDSLHEFRLTLGEQPIVVKGRITHCALIDVDQDLVKYRSGVQFVELSERVRAVIDDFVVRLGEKPRV